MELRLKCKNVPFLNERLYIERVEKRLRMSYPYQDEVGFVHAFFI